MDFQIVLVNDDADREKIRNHLRVVQSVQRKKKIEQRKQASSGLRSQTIVSRGPLAWRRKETVDEEPEASTAKSGRRAIVSTAVARRPVQPAPNTVDSKVHPLTILGAAPKDPFADYAIPWDTEADALFHFMMSSLGPCMYGYPPNPSHDIFRTQLFLSRSDPATLHTAMIMATNTKSRLAGHSLPGLRTLYHRVEAIRLINERFARFNAEADIQKRAQLQAECVSETTILAVMALSSMEKRWQMIGDSEVQSTGLQQLLILKGGIGVVHSEYPLTESALYGHALVAPRLLNPGSPALYDSRQPQLGGFMEQLALAAELITFLVPMLSSEYPKAGKELAFAFVPGTGIYNSIASPLPPWGVYQDNVVLIRNRIRAAILFYAHCIIARPQRDQTLSDFVEHLRWLAGQEWLWAKSLRMLQFMLVNEQKNTVLADSYSAWKTLRLVTAMCLSSQEFQELTIRCLLDSLSGRARSSNRDLKRIIEELSEFQDSLHALAVP